MDKLRCEHCNARIDAPLNNEDGTLQRCPNCYQRIFPMGGTGYKSKSVMRRFKIMKGEK